MMIPMPMLNGNAIRTRMAELDLGADYVASRLKMTANGFRNATSSRRTQQPLSERKAHKLAALLGIGLDVLYGKEPMSAQPRPSDKTAEEKAEQDERILTAPKPTDDAPQR